MKRNLGRFLFIFCMLVSLPLQASTYKWSATVNKSIVEVNEAIHLKYLCEFNDVSELYTIDFNPVQENEHYSIKILTESERIVNNKRVNSYEFIAFVHKPGKIVFDFDIVMKKTTQDSINSTILGRDNAQELAFTKTYLKQKTLSVDVRETPVNLIGELSMEVKRENPTVKAYEPYHMEIIIKGVGNFELLKPFEFNIAGVKVFSENIKQNISLTEDGYHGSWSQKLAFVSEKDFILPKLSVEYFNINEDKLKELSHEGVEVKVEQGFKKEELLETPKDDFEFPYDYIYYALTFLAGFLAGKIKFKRKAVSHAKDEKFFEKIKKSKSLDELVMVLAIEDADKYKNLIEQIENKDVIFLNDIKKILLKSDKNRDF